LGTHPRNLLYPSFFETDLSSPPNPAHCHDQAYLIVFANMSDLEQ